MEALTASMRYHLPNTWKYTFIDGEKECEAAAGIGEIFTGPYLCYHNAFSVQDINEQIEAIEDIIEDEGDYRSSTELQEHAANFLRPV